MIVDLEYDVLYYKDNEDSQTIQNSIKLSTCNMINDYKDDDVEPKPIIAFKKNNGYSYIFVSMFCSEQLLYLKFMEEGKMQYWFNYLSKKVIIKQYIYI